MEKHKLYCRLNDQTLEILNNILPWQTFSRDENSRIVGKCISQTKRNTAQVIPDERLIQLNSLIELNGKSVLEIGCLEGNHSVGLLMLGSKLTAVDARIENILKSFARTLAYGYSADFRLCDVDHQEDLHSLPHFDVITHIGVLYHLVDPIGHLKQILPRVSSGLLLDTHFVGMAQARESYEVNGKTYNFYRFNEGGRAAIYAGMYDHAKWLTLETIIELIKEEGLNIIRCDRRLERNGDRVMLIAKRG